jgi:Flp pilus assembly pilin Flp
MNLIGFLRKLWQEEEGIGTLEIILIVAVIVVIAVAFRKWIVQWVENLFMESNNEMKSSKLDTVNVPTP